MRVLWVHNFTPTVVSSGVFMHILHDRLREMGADITMHYTGSLRGISRIAASASQVRRLSRRFDIVHSQYGSACGYVSSFATCKKMLWLRGSDLLGMKTGGVFCRVHGICNRWLTRRSLRSYDKIIAVSRRMQGELKQIYPNANVEVLPSGIDLQTFRCMDRQEARRQLGEENDSSPWILFSSLAGAVNPTKRFPLAMDVVRLVQSRWPEAKLKCLTGVAHNQVPLWVNASNVVLLTSDREGWPNIIKEALSCNVPFVSTDVSDLKAIADVESSCTVAAADPQKLAEGVLKAIESERPMTLRRHVEWMDLDVVAHQVLRIYGEMCGDVST